MLINRTYFVGELNIPNTSNAATGGLTDHFITKYEDKFLREVLGYTLYKAFKTGWATDPIPQKWIDLVEGVEYTSLANETTYWRGLDSSVSGVSSIDVSPIANYVYYWFTRNEHTQRAAMGEVKAKTENADTANPGLKMVRAWNEMAGWICELVDYLDAKKDTYPEWADQNVWRMRNQFRRINEFNI